MWCWALVLCGCSGGGASGGGSTIRTANVSSQAFCFVAATIRSSLSAAFAGSGGRYRSFDLFVAAVFKKHKHVTNSGKPRNVQEALADRLLA